MKSTELITFENEILGTIRGFIDKDGEPWFLAAQVCRCLGIKNSRDAIQSLKQRMNVVKDFFTNRTVTSTDTPNWCTVSNRNLEWGVKTISLQEGKTHTQLTIINEQWLYELVFASRKRTAIIFRAWVTGEVLPSLRKRGEYRMEGKLIRRSLTDTIHDCGENERMKGHAYSTYSALINKSLGLPRKVNRNTLTAEILVKLAKRVDLVRTLVAEGKTYNQVKDFLEKNFIEQGA